jgi:hypothetical protein
MSDKNIKRTMQNTPTRVVRFVYLEQFFVRSLSTHTSRAVSMGLYAGLRFVRDLIEETRVVLINCSKKMKTVRMSSCLFMHNHVHRLRGRNVNIFDETDSLRY